MSAIRCAITRSSGTAVSAPARSRSTPPPDLGAALAALHISSSEAVRRKPGGLSLYVLPLGLPLPDSCGTAGFNRALQGATVGPAIEAPHEQVRSYSNPRNGIARLRRDRTDAADDATQWLHR